MKYDIEFPSQCSPSALAEFSLNLEKLPEQDGDLKILTSNVGFFTPTALVMLAKLCRKRARQFENERIVYTGLNLHPYANNLGFSDALNLEGRPYPQGAFGGKSYIPISIMVRDDLEERAAAEGIEFGDAIQQRCNDIAQIVEQGKSKALQKVVANSFVEIFRNCFEHGEASGAVFCAQYWEGTSEVEVCIADRGIGICSSLQESKYNKPGDDREAIYLA